MVQYSITVLVGNRKLIKYLQLKKSKHSFLIMFFHVCFFTEPLLLGVIKLAVLIGTFFNVVYVFTFF